MNRHILDFGSQVLGSVDRIFALGLMKAGRYRMQWKEDRNANYHAMKAKGHLEMYLSGEKIDPDTGEPHLSNACSRLLIALWHHFNEEKRYFE